MHCYCFSGLSRLLSEHIGIILIRAHSRPWEHTGLSSFSRDPMPARYKWHSTVSTKHLYNICTMWADVVQMLYKCFVLTGSSLASFITVNMNEPEPTLLLIYHQNDCCPALNINPIDFLLWLFIIIYSKQTQNICITFTQCWTNVGPTLHKCYTNVLCLLSCSTSNRKQPATGDIAKCSLTCRKYCQSSKLVKQSSQHIYHSYLNQD